MQLSMFLGHQLNKRCFHSYEQLRVIDVLIKNVSFTCVSDFSVSDLTNNGKKAETPKQRQRTTCKR